MGVYTLRRKPAEGKAVRGTLYAIDENIITGRTTETKICGILENADYLIPAGNYSVIVNVSPRFGKLMPLLMGVPGRSGIRIHGGVKPEHSKGCLLITRKAEYAELVHRMWKEQEENEPIRVRIEDSKI